jgi:hypothetical protein
MLSESHGGTPPTSLEIGCPRNSTPAACAISLNGMTRSPAAAGTGGDDIIIGYDDVYRYCRLRNSADPPERMHRRPAHQADPLRCANRGPRTKTGGVKTAGFCRSSGGDYLSPVRGTDGVVRRSREKFHLPDRRNETAPRNRRPRLDRSAQPSPVPRCTARTSVPRYTVRIGRPRLGQLPEIGGLHDNSPVPKPGRRRRPHRGRVQQGVERASNSL